MSHSRTRIAAVTVLGSAFILQGCLAKTAMDVVTAPVRVVSKAVDLVTVSQSEKDEKRGRKMRKEEERIGKLEREYDEYQRECENGDRKSCEKAREVYAELYPDR